MAASKGSCSVADTIIRPSEAWQRGLLSVSEMASDCMASVHWHNAFGFVLPAFDRLSP
jgi:hypothetical protein